MVKCPRCGTETSSVVKEWNYGPFHVKEYFCKKCQKKFNLYFRKGKLSHTIRIGK